jgi:hypothetical protein
METVYVTWKSFIDQENRRPVHIYPRSIYPIIEIIHTTVGVTISYGIGEPVVIAKVFPGQRGVFRVEEEYTEIVVTPEYHQNLVDTDPKKVVGYTTIRFSDENWQNLTLPAPFWKSYRVPSLTLSDSHDAIHGPGTDMIIDSPVIYAIQALRSPNTGFYSPSATSAFDSSTYRDDYQGVGIYGLDKQTNPSIPRLRMIDVGQNGEVRTEVTGGAVQISGPVNVNGTVQVSSGQINAAINGSINLPIYQVRSAPASRATLESVYLYTAILRGTSAGTRGVSVTLTAGGTAVLLAVTPGSTAKLGLRKCTCTIYGASAAATVALRWQRFTGTISGGSAIAIAQLLMEGPGAQATVTGQPTSVGGLIATVRFENVLQVTTTSYDIIETITDPLHVIPPASYGYALIIESSAAVTVRVLALLVFEEYS